MTLKTFRIYWDEGPDVGGPYGPYRQSERLDKYRAAAELLVERGFAYYDFDAKIRDKEEIEETYASEEGRLTLKDRPAARQLDPREAKKRAEKGEPYVIRVKIPEDKIFKYEDWMLKKKVQFQGKEVPDLILLKSDGFPTYHLAVVVDDSEMKISHVLRGQEWISTTPIHLHLYDGLKKPVPIIGHFTVILDPKTAKKFSKRDLEGTFGVKRWLDNGYLPEAILNYLMLLGWAPKDNGELFTLEEFIEVFNQAGVQKANPTFNAQKLDWFNQQYIRALDDVDLGQKIQKYTQRTETEIAQVLPLIKDRLVTLKDFDSLTEYFFETPTVDQKLFSSISVQPTIILEHAIKTIEANWDGKILESEARDYCTKNTIKVGDYFMVLRIALTGKTATPPLWQIMEVLGKEETIRRLSQISNTKY